MLSAVQKMFFLMMLAFIAALPTYGQTQAQTDTATYYSEDPKVNGIRHRFLAGARIGAVFAFGLEFNYIYKPHNTEIFYLAAAAETSIVLNSVNAGGGIFLGNSGIGLGCRYNYMLWFELEDSERNSPGVAPEIVYYRRLGFRSNIYLNLHAGAVFTRDERVFPDISFGLFLPLQ
jgi:hypothetical protein